MPYQRNKSYTSVERAILTTIIYSDIFNFPLTKEELWQFLISTKPINKVAFETALHQIPLPNLIVAQDGFYCLVGKESCIKKRKDALSEVSKKFRLAQKIAAGLSRIPSIIFIGVSGGLAANNVTAEDDIDLFIIVKENTLFVSRFWIVLLLELMRVRRSRLSRHTANTICVNLLIDEASLTWAKDKQDLYTAREIAQIKPLFERSGTYQLFLEKNQWIIRFLPNALTALPQVLISKDKESSRSGKALMIWFEQIMRAVQMLYMGRHRTTEIVTKHHLAFHPNDYRTKTLEQLKLKLRQIGLLTNF